MLGSVKPGSSGRGYKRLGSHVTGSLLLVNGAKQILDCSWSEWFRQLRCKAAEAGRRFVAVDPKYTSQICSRCGFMHPDNRKTLADFECLSCGYQDNADHNAAVNISARNEPLDANVSGVALCVV
jgi:putative transposase